MYPKISQLFFCLGQSVIIYSTLYPHISIKTLSLCFLFLPKPVSSAGGGAAGAEVLGVDRRFHLGVSLDVSVDVD